MGIPVDGGSLPNIMYVFNAEEPCSCHRDASEFAKDNVDAKYLFWTSSTHRFSKDVGGNCIVFKTCDEKKRIPLNESGITYQLKPKEWSKSGMRRI